MNHHFQLVTDYIVALSFVTQLVLVTLQIRLWLRTRHSSPLILAAASALGILFLVIEGALIVITGHPNLRWRAYKLLALLLTAQAVIGIWGVWALFAAFEQKYLRDPRRAR